MQTLVVTGAAGFVGSALCRYLRKNNLAKVIGVDSLTGTGSREAVGILANDPMFQLVEADISDARLMAELFGRSLPDGIIHLAAETRTDRSIEASADFLRTNIVGTYALLETTRVYLSSADGEKKRDSFRFLHVSTGKVYGSLGREASFTEEAAYAPNSIYASTKAAADLLARAWHKTNGIPVIVAHSCNNYGSLQFPEKLLPMAIVNALNGRPIPIYGKGENSRDWLYVEDHAKALALLFAQGKVGEKYHVGGDHRICDIDLIRLLCDVLEEEFPNLPCPPRKLVTFVDERPGQDLHVALDSSKIRRETGWSPETSLDKGLRETARWYSINQNWCDNIKSRKYAAFRPLVDPVQ